MKKRILEWGKTLVIVVLSCTLVLLTLAALPADTLRGNEHLSRLLQPLAPVLGLPRAELTYVEADQPVTGAAQPIAITVCGDGGRGTVMGNFAQLDAAFETLGSALGQAMDTAGELTPVTEAQVRTALSGTSVAFFYTGELPAAVLASWLGAELETDAAAELCILAIREDVVTLYLAGSQCLAAETALDAGTLEKLLETIRPDGSALGFETELQIDPLSLIPEGDLVLPGGTVTNPCTGRALNELATGLGFNPYGDNRYSDNQGGTHFSEANLALHVTADGVVRLTSSAQELFQAADDSDAALAELARQLTQQVTGGDFGDGRLYLTDLTREEDRTVCTFEYYVSGYPVTLGESAAVVTFQGRAMTGMIMTARSFTVGGSLCYPLPVRQAAAIQESSRRLQLQYRVSGSTLEVGWKK